MITSEFIKLLLEEDPEGTAHLCVAGGAITFLEKTPGYYDGCYNYMRGKVFVKARRGMKVIVHTTSPSGIVWDEEGDMEAVRKRIDLTDYKFSGLELERELHKSFWDELEGLAVEVRGL